MIFDKISSTLKSRKQDYVIYQGQILPPKVLRTGGAHFQDDASYFASAQNEARRLAICGFKSNARILDLGCGSGRLPIGILIVHGDTVDYHGIDVRKSVVDWCTQVITKKHPKFIFTHIDIKNERYNPSGKAVNDRFRLPVQDNSYDILSLYSVFSHMVIEDIQGYLKEFRRILAPSGKIFFTAFVEEGTPDMTINPENYGMKWSGELHCVRFNQEYFANLLQSSGFKVDQFVHGQETDGQSAFYISNQSGIA
jgi:ubiquinone/menaquinone biosynthesis C-methylase UbiE